MPELSLSLTVRELTAADLPACGWAGTGVPDGLARSGRGEVDYLVVCPPSGRPVTDDSPADGTSGTPTGRPAGTKP